MNDQIRRVNLDGNGTETPVYVVAHLGLNHNGRASDARQLIRQADAAGADAVALPVYHTDAVVSEQAELAPGRREHVGELSENPRNMLGRYELAPETVHDLFAFAGERDLDVLPAPRDTESLSELSPDKRSGLLIEAGDLTFTPLVEACADTGRPLLLSTGLHELDEVDRVMDHLSDTAPAGNLIPLYQACCYPATVDDLDMRTLSKYVERYGTTVGFSDHTTGFQAAEMAVSLGAGVIVRHITLDRDADGPDHVIGLEPERFHTCVRRIRDVENALGTGQKAMSDTERQLRPYLLRSLAVRHSTEAGTSLEPEDLTALRPAEGIPLRRRSNVTGKQLNTDRKSGELLFPEDLERDS
jgi:sialic acid synthase SpsE